MRAAVVERFGDRVATEGGEIDRRAIARIVFEDRAQLDWLERLLHPRVAREQRAWRERLAAQPTPPALAVTEIPLLYEVGAEAGFDAVVVITAPAGVRRVRAKVSPERRERRLIPDEEKVRRADFAYVNDGTLAELDAFVGSVVEQLAARR